MPIAAAPTKLAPSHAVLLPDARRVTTRQATASDGTAIVELYESLSSASRYQRFFSPTPRLTSQLLRSLTDLSRSEVWLAFDGDRCVGEARIVRYRDQDRADLAVTVADAYQHHGLGRHLARLAVSERRHQGSVTVSILPGNTAAVRIARRGQVPLRFDGGVLEGSIARRRSASRRATAAIRQIPHPTEVPTMSKHDPKIDRLAEIGLFRHLTRRQLQAVAKVSNEYDVARGTVLCREGGVGRECFVVHDGHATVTIAGEEVATIGPGGLFGELALLDGEPRTATVTAATDMGLLVFSRPEFIELLADVPIVSRRILEAIGARLRAADARLHATRLSA